MFGLAGIFLIVGLVVGFGADDFEAMVINIFCCLVYLILAAWCSKNPFGATLTALIIYHHGDRQCFRRTNVFV